jgi:hypothetical protein
LPRANGDSRSWREHVVLVIEQVDAQEAGILLDLDAIEQAKRQLAWIHRETVGTHGVQGSPSMTYSTEVAPRPA